MRRPSSTRPISRRSFLRTSALATPLLAAGCRRLAGRSNTAEDFVSVRGAQFELQGKPYRFFGVNLWPAAYLGDEGLPGGRQRLQRELDHLERIGVNNVRLLAGSEASPLSSAITPAIRGSSGEVNERLLRGLDFCLAEMGRRNQKAVLMLSNFWQWSGGFAEYVRRVTGEAIPDPDQPRQGQGDWGAFMRSSARFYSTPEAQSLYRGFVRQLIHRRNTVTGVAYADDPCIMTWELANEPRPGTDDESGTKNVPAFVKWVEDTARFIRAEAPRQLVCTGSEGIVGCLGSPATFLAAHQTDAIDYVTVHLWLKNWGWLKEPRLSPEFEVAAERARGFVEEHTRLATEVLRKPLVLEEFGLPRDEESLDPAAPATARDEYFRRMAAQVVESARAGRALQAANIWAWGGEGRAEGKTPHYAATSLLGDPFCEPQGLNSVFDTDSTTLRILSEANRNLSALAG